MFSTDDPIPRDDVHPDNVRELVLFCQTDSLCYGQLVLPTARELLASPELVDDQRVAIWVEVVSSCVRQYEYEFSEPGYREFTDPEVEQAARDLDYYFTTFYSGSKSEEQDLIKHPCTHMVLDF